MKIRNKRVVITGGTSGIGYEMVKILHRDNELIVISRNAKKLEELKSKHNEIFTYPVDLSELKEVEVVANSIVTAFDKVDILINNAASQNTAEFLDDKFNYDDIMKEINLNFTSVCSLSYLLLPALIHEKNSVIHNVNSGLGLVPKKSSAVYCGTKGALNIFTQSLCYQLEKTNISVQQSFLPLVDTGMTRGRGINKLSAKKAAEEIIRGIVKGKIENNIGQIKLLRVLIRISPNLAKFILKNK